MEIRVHLNDELDAVVTIADLCEDHRWMRESYPEMVVLRRVEGCFRCQHEADARERRERAAQAERDARIEWFDPVSEITLHSNHRPFPGAMPAALDGRRLRPVEHMATVTGIPVGLLKNNPAFRELLVVWLPDSGYVGPADSAPDNWESAPVRLYTYAADERELRGLATIDATR